MLLLTEASC